MVRFVIFWEMGCQLLCAGSSAEGIMVSFSRVLEKISLTHCCKVWDVFKVLATCSLIRVNTMIISAITLWMEWSLVSSWAEWRGNNLMKAHFPKFIQQQSIIPGLHYNFPTYRFTSLIFIELFLLSLEIYSQIKWVAFWMKDSISVNNKCTHMYLFPLLYFPFDLIIWDGSYPLNEYQNWPIEGYHSPKGEQESWL